MGIPLTTARSTSNYVQLSCRSLFLQRTTCHKCSQSSSATGYPGMKTSWAKEPGKVPRVQEGIMGSTAISGRGVTSEYSIWRVLMAAAVGTMIEWYDFYIFGSLAAVLALKFYPPGNQTFAYIAYLATFAVGFVVRPFGALFFGRIGDLIGRKYAFLVTLVIMGSATAAIGFMPTFKTAGWFAPILLICIRVLQGLALGGEYGGAAVYVAEHVPDNKRGFYTSFIQITATLGLFVSLLVILATQSSMTTAAFNDYGWRIPVLLSMFLVGISFYIRSTMTNS